MAKTTSKMVPAVLAILVVLIAVASCCAADIDPPPRPRGQQVHLFEATVRVPEDGEVDDPEEYNFRLLAAVLGSVEAARGAMYESYPGLFTALLTNNQARRLSKVPGVLEVTERDDLVSTVVRH